jgi:hypothetical protein
MTPATLDLQQRQDIGHRRYGIKPIKFEGFPPGD